MIQQYTFGSSLYGPRLAIFGAVHGNEPCGTEAIMRIVDEIGRGTLRIHGGLLTLVPIANPEAYKQKKRYIEKNLNRVFKPQLNDKAHRAYEEHLADYLKNILQTSDYLLDLHSMSCGNDPFIVGHVDEGGNDIQQFSYATGIGTTVSGWSELYAGSGQRATDEYMHATKKVGICLECGQHEDKHAVDIGYKAVIGVLKHLGMLSGTPRYAQEKHHLHLTTVTYKQSAGHLCKSRQHGDKVLKGEPIAQYDTGEVLTAQHDGLVVLPKTGASIGEEWYYLGKEIST